MDYTTALAIARRYNDLELARFVAKYLSTENIDIDSALCVLNDTRYYPPVGDTNKGFKVKFVDEFKDYICTEYKEEEERFYKNEDDANTSSYNYNHTSSLDYPISRIVKVSKTKYFNHKEWLDLHSK